MLILHTIKKGNCTDWSICTCNKYHFGEGVDCIFKLEYVSIEMDKNHTLLYLSQHTATYCLITYYDSIDYS